LSFSISYYLQNNGQSIEEGKTKVKH